MLIRCLVVCFLAAAAVVSAADAPAVAARLTPAQLADYDASGVSADKVLSSVLDERDAARAQLAPLQTQATALSAQVKQLQQELLLANQARDAAIAARQKSDALLTQIKQLLGIP